MSRNARPDFSAGRDERPGGRDLDKLFDKSREPANDAEDGEEEPRGRGKLDVEKARERIAASRRKDFSKLPDERGHRGGGESNNRGPMILILAAVVLAVFGAAVWNAYRDGVRVEGGDAVTPELASAGAFKKRPEGAAATATAPVDASVYGAMERAPAALAGSPAPQEPAPVENARVEGIIEPKPEPKPAPVAVAKSEPATPPAKIEAGAPVSLTAAPKPAAVAPVAAPVVAKAEPAPPTGKFAVQIGALSSQSAAEAEWAKRVKAQPDLFASATREVVKAEVNGKTVYRLRATGFVKPADAEQFCSSYKLLGGACYRVAG